jgi:hypothetical protein
VSLNVLRVLLRINKLECVPLVKLRDVFNVKVKLNALNVIVAFNILRKELLVDNVLVLAKVAKKISKHAQCVKQGSFYMKVNAEIRVLRIYIKAKPKNHANSALW